MSWLDDASANRLVQSYMRSLLDVSGNFKVRYPITVSSGGGGGGGSSTTISDPSAVTWTQIGADIDGVSSGDRFGGKVDLSSDGTILVAGGTYNRDNGQTMNGHVRVFQSDGSSWSQLGQSIAGTSQYQQVGANVSISGDGTVIAIAQHKYNGDINTTYVQIYKYITDTWVQLGGDIVEGASTQLGINADGVNLNYSGNIIVVGAPHGPTYGDEGAVYVYEYVNSAWTQLGQTLVGVQTHSNFTSRFGWSTAINDDGTIIAVGANDASLSNRKEGIIYVYQYDGSSTWTQLGGDINGPDEERDERWGSTVDLNSDGTIVASGSGGNNGVNGGDSGTTRVYQYDGSSWNMLGTEIDGEHGGDKSGDKSVRLSDDGTVVAIGATHNDDTGNDAGQVRVYYYVNGAWTKIGDDIHGEGAGDQFGSTIAISGDGSKVAIGSQFNDGIPNNSGHVRIFDGGFGSGGGGGGGGGTIRSIGMLDVSAGTVSILDNTIDVSSGVVDISGTTWMNRGDSGGTLSSPYEYDLVIESSKTGSGDAVLQIETAGQSQAFSVRADGTMYSNNSSRYSSDDRRKVNEQHIINATETLNKLFPQIYTKLDKFENDGGKPIGTESGLIAQEIYYNARELRHLVDTRNYYPPDYDLCGNPIEVVLSKDNIQNDIDYNDLGWGRETACVNYIGLIPYIIKSNQEQQEIIENTQQLNDNEKELEEEIESRLTALET